MFVLPRPPPTRDGRAVMRFVNRPVSAEVTCEVRNLRVVHDEGTEWFPSIPACETFQDEFANRTMIVHSRLEEFDEITRLFCEGGAAVLARLKHQLIFDEQWEREAIESDSLMALWSLFSHQANCIMISDMVNQEFVARRSIEKLALASMFGAMTTAEFLERRFILAAQTAQWRAVVDEARASAALSTLEFTCRNNGELLLQFEAACRRRVVAFRRIVIDQQHLMNVEASQRTSLLDAFFQSRRRALSDFAELTLCEVWRENELEKGFDFSVASFFDDNATLIQSVVRGYLVRVKRGRRAAEVLCF